MASVNSVVLAVPPRSRVRIRPSPSTRSSAARIRAALGRVLADGKVRTRDLGGTATTTEFTDAICRQLEWS